MYFWRASVGAGLLAAVLAGACGSVGDPSAVPYESDPAGPSSSASGGAAASASSSSSGSSASSASSSGGSGGVGLAPLTAVFEPVALEPNAEHTYCEIRRLDNELPVHANQVHTTVSGIVRDLAVYKLDGDTERIGPFECTLHSSLAGAPLYLGGPAGVPLTITQRADEVLQFASTDGIALAPHQLILLQVHALAPNATATASASVTFTPMDDAAFLREVGMVLAGSEDFQLVNEGETLLTTSFVIPAVLAGTELLALSGRQHGRGTGVTLRHGGSTLYDSSGSAEPPTTVLDPPVSLAAGDTFTLGCTWLHDGTSYVQAGESEAREQCFVRAHYAASRGARFCLYDQGTLAHGTCCPGELGCAN